MNFNCALNLNVLLVLVLVFIKTSLGQGCDSEDFNCISCTDYQKCSAGSPDGAVISCKSGESCSDIQLKKCQLKLNCSALNECTQAGVFPDVMVDSNFYVCLSDASSGFIKYKFSCPEKNFFDQSSLSCVPRTVTLSTTSTYMTSSSTQYPSSKPIPTTPAIPTTSATPSTLTTLTTPTVLTTPTIPTTSATLTSPPTPSTLTTLTTPTVLTTPTTPTAFTTLTTPTTSITPIPFKCTAPGIFFNPSNCKMYYRCSTALKAFFYICPGNSYFNENILKCSLVITPTCQEQILRNSSSIPSPVTIPATTSTIITTPFTTTTPTITITTPFTTASATVSTTTPVISTSATTTKLPIFTTSTQGTTTAATDSPLTTPISCKTGGVFANPLDCKTYYRCSLSGKIYRYVCPNNTYFNEITQRCSLIITARCKTLN